jgi:putative acetyltransferase
VQICDEASAYLREVFELNTKAFPTDAEARLVDNLRKNGDLEISLVAVIDEKIVGHVAFSRMTAPFRALGLAPVAVLPLHQRQGIGAALIRAGLERAKASGWNGVFVLGDNAYYERFGFRAELATGFSCRFAGPHFMALALSGDALPQSHGEVSYAAAFDSLG